MCGICGIANDDPSRAVDGDALGRMNDALRHRGPDDEGRWFGPGMGLAMRRLAVQDVAGGAQPMATENESHVLIFNGEIYNFPDLRRELEKKGYAFRTHCDTEVVLRMFEGYGDEAVHHFNGMFALALYERERDRLTLYRDRLGIKPLFYTYRNGTLAFASELDALAQGGFVDGEMNYSALRDYFTYLYVPCPDTIYDGVEKVRPGEKIVFERGGVKRERYWRFQYDVNEMWDLDSAAERYMELLTESVRMRKISDVPLGAFLSGGIDSSSVVGTLAHVSNGPVKTFTIGFDDDHADELWYARQAAEAFHTEHTEEILQPELVPMMSELVRHFGEPFADSSAVPTWLVSKVAREAVTVALSGDGGDELFAGYTWMVMNHDVARYRKVPAPIRRFADSALFFMPRSDTINKARRFSSDAFMEPYRSFKRRHTCFGEAQRERLFNEATRNRLAFDTTDRFGEHGAEAGDISPDDWMLYQDTMMYLPDDILTKVDRMSMANGLEARVPLLDHRMVEFAATVPFQLKLQGHTTKRLVKHAARKLLPKSLLKQRKQGFSIPIHRWFRGELAGYFRELVLSEDSRCVTYIDPKYAQTLFESHLSHTENYGHHLWAMLVFEEWLRGRGK